VIARLEAIGIRRLEDLAGRVPEDLVIEVNLEGGRPIWHPPMATAAMANLIRAAEARAWTATPSADARPEGLRCGL
jgi:hypothetical protein